MAVSSVLKKLVLLPCSKLFGFITYMRNQFFEWKILPQHSFDIPVVVIGNIAVGGTGKTPHTEYVVEHLRHSFRVAVLSRGYKRKTKGFVLATPESKPSDIGDESYQIYNKFEHKVVVAVCEDRVAGIKELLRLFPDIGLVVLDDAFQHRYVKPTVSIVLTEFNRPLYDDHMLPYGRLREPYRGILRADIVVATKCPETMSDLDYSLFKKNLDLFAWQEVFFSRYSYQHLMPMFPDATSSVPSLGWMDRYDSVLAVAGVENPRPFVRYLKSFMARVRVNIYSDHHAFTQKDMATLLRRYQTMPGNTRIMVTTEKDAMRMIDNPHFPEELKPYSYYLPVKVQFVSHGAGSFIETLTQKIKAAKALNSRKTL